MTDEMMDSAVTAAAEAVGDDWRTELDGELGALVAAKGWRNPGEAIKSYAHLERMVGADTIAVPAGDAPAEAWNGLWERLGRPATPEGYAFERPADDVPYNDAAADWFKRTAYEIGLTDQQAKRLHDSFISQTQATAALEQDPDEPAIDEKLRTLWGRQYPARLAEARRAINAFLPEGDEFFNLSEKIGEIPLLQLLARVGRAIGEDSLVGGGTDGGHRGSTDARSEIRRLQSAARTDPKHPYLDKAHPDHDATVRRMEALFERAYGT